MIDREAYCPFVTPNITKDDAEKTCQCLCYGHISILQIPLTSGESFEMTLDLRVHSSSHRAECLPFVRLASKDPKDSGVGWPVVKEDRFSRSCGIAASSRHLPDPVSLFGRKSHGE